jgi:hypothetical protein
MGHSFFRFESQKRLSAKSGQRLIFVWPFGETNAATNKGWARRGKIKVCAFVRETTGTSLTNARPN